MNICSGKQNHKLITATACQRILLPQAGMEDVGCRPQDLIANQMSMGIVDLLEMIDIDRQDRECLLEHEGILKLMGTKREELAPVM